MLDKLTISEVLLHLLVSMGSSRQEYWSGLPFPSPGDLPDPGIKSASPALQLVAQMVKHLPAIRETWVRSLGWEDPLETHHVKCQTG